MNKPGNSKGNRRPSKFRQRDLARAVRGVLASGLQVERIVIAPDGSIQVFPTRDDKPAPADYPADRNEWDEVLKPRQ
jgi:hypothetical protein